MSGRLRSIDIIRGAAATAVVLFHSHFDFALGRIGVDAFFVVSGFVIYFSAQGRSARDFLAARALRIFPIYWVAAAWLLIPLLSGSMSPEVFVEQALLFPMWITSNVPSYSIAWTLVLECLFYGATAIAIKRGTYVHLLIAYGLFLSAWTAGASHLVHWLGHPMILEFLAGVAIARLPKHRGLGSIALAAAGAWLVLLVFMSPLFPHGWTRVLLFGIPASLAVYGAVCHEHRLSGKLVELLCLLGGASYSIYLFHPYVIRLSGAAPWPINFIMAMATGMAAWMLIERPIMRRISAERNLRSNAREANRMAN
jgi:peptidoglycan/LPS O-acetylase OafA/YrhL